MKSIRKILFSSLIMIGLMSAWTGCVGVGVGVRGNVGYGDPWYRDGVWLDGGGRGWYGGGAYIHPGGGHHGYRR